MTTLALPLLYNPAAGRGRMGRRAAAICRLLAENGVRHEAIASRGPGDIERRVGELVGEGHRRLLVVGGDGSVNEAVNGIMASDPSVGLGVIPSGTGNDFAKACATPPHWEHATALLADRLNSDTPPRPVDVGRCNNRYFANGAGIGFDARVSAIAKRISLPIGDLVYLLGVFRALAQGVATPRLTLRYAGETYEGPVTLISAANGPWVGGVFNIAPDAENDDGLLDLVYAMPVGRIRLLTLLPRILQGTHRQAPEVRERRVRSLEIVADQPLPCHLDGEVQPEARRFRIELLPGALRLL